MRVEVESLRVHYHPADVRRGVGATYLLDLPLARRLEGKPDPVVKILGVPENQSAGSAPENTAAGPAPETKAVGPEDSEEGEGVEVGPDAVPDPAPFTVDPDLGDFVAELEDPEVLEGMLRLELDGKNRDTAVRVLKQRRDELLEA